MATTRSVYLALSRQSKAQRAHFGIFIPNAHCVRTTLSEDYRSNSCTGTVIHVVGEPLMAGYALEFKRNFECSTEPDLEKLVLLGSVNTSDIYECDATNSAIRETTVRSIMERHAATVEPPPRGQDVRKPVDGVNTRRCQEWTMEFLNLLVRQDILGAEAVIIAQKERDAATHGIFGCKNA